MNPILDPQIRRKLNSYNYDDDVRELKEIVSQKQNGLTDQEVKRIQFFRKRYKDFKFDDEGILIYQPLDLQVATKAGIPNILKNLYENRETGLGHGLNQFYKIVTNLYLNITRKETSEFLKSQTLYQLTRPIVKPKNPTIKATGPNHIWSTDLIDMGKYASQNKHFNYILSVVDTYDKRVWLRKIKTKTANNIAKEFKKIFAEGKPKLLLNDNGNEFAGEFKQLLKENGVKNLTTESYVPQPNIENLNGQIRKMISQHFILNNKTVWIHNLNEIERNLNSFNAIDKEKRQLQPPPPKNETRREPKFGVGESVRISQKAIVTDVRKAYKSGLQKHIHVKWSVDIYFVHKTYKPGTSNGFYKYGLKNGGDEVIKNTDGTISRFRESDLTAVPHNSLDLLSEDDSNRINQI